MQRTMSDDAYDYALKLRQEGLSDKDIADKLSKKYANLNATGWSGKTVRYWLGQRNDCPND